MQVNVEGRQFMVRWMYNHSFFPDFAKYMLMDEGKAEELRKLSLRKQVEFLVNWKVADKSSIEGLVNNSSDTTNCLIYEGDKVVSEGSVVKYHKDADNRPLARKYSLAKAVGNLFPDNKEARKAFWNAYNSRNKEVKIAQIVHPIE